MKPVFVVVVLYNTRVFFGRVAVTYSVWNIVLSSSFHLFLIVLSLIHFNTISSFKSCFVFLFYPEIPFWFDPEHSWLPSSYFLNLPDLVVQASPLHTTSRWTQFRPHLHCSHPINPVHLSSFLLILYAYFSLLVFLNRSKVHALVKYTSSWFCFVPFTRKWFTWPLLTLLHLYSHKDRMENT